MDKKKILVVEDEETLRKALVEYLEEEGFEVLEAGDGEEALKIAKTKKIDLMLLDIILPKKDGYQVLDEIKKNEKISQIPIVLLTNLESAEDIQKAFDRGATTYLIKSDYKLEEVSRKIKETLKI